ncbi:MAG: precorrin-2 C(20)-methyltransferase [Bacillota bacterium]
MSSGIFYGVGVGPGDPGLLTLKAVQLLREARVVVAPRSAPGQDSLALAVARDHLPAACLILHLHFPMTKNESCLEEAWDDALAQVRAHLDAGEDVVFLTIGDPMLYSTCIYLLQRLKAGGYQVRVIAGVPSFCAAAAAAAFPLAAGEERIAVFPWKGDDSLSPSFLGSFDTVVLLKVASHLNGAVAALQQADMLEHSVLVSNCGRPDEEISSDLRDAVRRKEPLPYLSLILARRQKEI